MIQSTTKSDDSIENQQESTSISEEVTSTPSETVPSPVSISDIVKSDNVNRLAKLEVSLSNAPAFVVDPLNCFADLPPFLEALSISGLILTNIRVSEEHEADVLLQTKWFKRCAISTRTLRDQVFEKSSRAGYVLLICVPTVNLFKQVHRQSEPAEWSSFVKERIGLCLSSIHNLEKLASQQLRLENALFCYVLHSNGKEVSLLETDELPAAVKTLSDYLTNTLEESVTNEQKLKEL